MRAIGPSTRRARRRRARLRCVAPRRSALGSSSVSSSAAPRITVGRLLKSWAMPPARRPTASSRWHSRTCSSSRLRSVTSRITSRCRPGTTYRRARRTPRGTDGRRPAARPSRRFASSARGLAPTLGEIRPTVPMKSAPLRPITSPFVRPNNAPPRDWPRRSVPRHPRFSIESSVYSNTARNVSPLVTRAWSSAFTRASSTLSTGAPGARAPSRRAAPNRQVRRGNRRHPPRVRRRGSGAAAGHR